MWGFPEKTPYLWNLKNCGRSHHLHCRSPSTNASIVCKTTVCSLCFKCRMRQNIFRHCPSSFVWLLTPRSSFASTPSICTILINISMDIADWPPSMRLTVLALIPACSATFSCDMLISFLRSRIRLPNLIKSCDPARLPNMHLLPSLNLSGTLRHHAVKCAAHFTSAIPPSPAPWLCDTVP